MQLSILRPRLRISSNKRQLDLPPRRRTPQLSLALGLSNSLLCFRARLLRAVHRRLSSHASVPSADLPAVSAHTSASRSIASSPTGYVRGSTLLSQNLLRTRYDDIEARLRGAGCLSPATYSKGFVSLIDARQNQTTAFMPTVRACLYYSRALELCTVAQVVVAIKTS